MIECTPNVISILQVGLGWLLGWLIINVIVPFIAGFIKGYKKCQVR